MGVQDADLLDLLLALEIPVADPAPQEKNNRQDALNLSGWAHADQRRDLCALAADARFHPAFHRALKPAAAPCSRSGCAVSPATPPQRACPESPMPSRV